MRDNYYRGSRYSRTNNEKGRKSSYSSSTKERVQELRDRTGASRRPFFRVRDELVENSEKVKEIVKG